MFDVLDPERAVRAGRPLRQVAARGDGGALLVASARVIEHGLRASVLIVPDLFRVDLAPKGESTEFHLRALTDHPTLWSSDAATADAFARRGPAEPLGFEASFDLPEGRLVAALRIVLVGDDDLEAIYACARATVRPAEPA